MTDPKFKVPPGQHIENIPALYRESFESLRSPESDPVGNTWAIISIDFEGEPRTALCSLRYDPETTNPISWIPIFINYPHAKEDEQSYALIHQIGDNPKIN